MDAHLRRKNEYALVDYFTATAPVFVEFYAYLLHNACTKACVEDAGGGNLRPHMLIPRPALQRIDQNFDLQADEQTFR